MATSFRYREVEGGIRLLGSRIEDEDLVIPVEYEGHPVVEIERQTFFVAAVLRTVRLEEGSKLRKVSSGAFFDCPNLESVDLRAASGLTVVEGSPVWGCYHLSTLLLPVSVEAFDVAAWSLKAPVHGSFFAPGLKCSKVRSPKDKMTAATSFVRGICVDGASTPDVVKTYQSYIKGHASEVVGQLGFEVKPLQWMLDNKCIAAKDVDSLLLQAEERGLAEQAVMLREYKDSLPARKSVGKQTTRKRMAAKKPAKLVEPLVAEWLKKVKIEVKIRRAVTSGVALASGEGECSPEAVQLLIERCSCPRKDAYWSAKAGSQDFETLSYLKDDSDSYHGVWIGEGNLQKISGTTAVINEIASWIDPDALSQKLEEVYYDKGVELALVALGRFAKGDAVKRFIEHIPQLDRYGRGTKEVAIAHGALVYNDSLEVARFFNSIRTPPKSWSISLLRAYAEAHDTTEDDLRDSMLSVPAFDSEGKLAIDLGIKTVTATIGEDLKISLYDDGAGKVVKSLPKRGVDPDVYEREKARLADVRKEVRETVRKRRELLLSDYLSGRGRKAASWKNAYLGNPVLRSVARLVVWQQGKSTFTVSGTALIDSGGCPYDLTDEKVCVAHPLQMTKADVNAWRDYFARNGLKQPFEQVWEKVVDRKSIKPDRYAGTPIPFYRFKGREKHGITVTDNDYHNDIRIEFAGCTAKVDRLDWHRHQIEMTDRFEIKTFGFNRYTRTVNHIVAYLDKLCIYPRIADNDMTVMEEVDDCTLAQIIDYIDVASESGATELAAALLEYREERFPEYGSVQSLLLA